ncbi:hypothetical protein [Hymenobacter cavernae]|uniref:Uncharacterized protein n=1 Tax=Hymenobacter cavernae TaxID=2044852 RepID=A0ABQ1UTW4_9BACT|nr:hypothetical protein [Hymenobacter cavernae]GGF26696.1 hypothetical protein GCM10011383_42780 [Hymenobacter cavernae]
MRYYITPSYYPNFQLDVVSFENKLIKLYTTENHFIYSLITPPDGWGWRVTEGEHYLEIFIANDQATIEFKGSSYTWLARFSFFAWSQYPVCKGIYLINEDLDRTYLLRNDTTIEDLITLFSY